MYRESLLQHNSAFEKLLDLIPAKFYVPVDNDQIDSKYQKNKRTKSQKQQEAEERKANSQAAKRAKVSLLFLIQLDPENVKSALDAQQDRRKAIDESIEMEFSDNENAERDSEETSIQSKDAAQESSEENEAEASWDTAQRAMDTISGEGEDSISPVPTQRRATASELRERLHNKIEMLHRKRNAAGMDSQDTIPGSKQELMEERRRQRGEMRDRRRRERKEARRQAKEQNTNRDPARSKSTSVGLSRQPGLLVNQETKPQSESSSQSEQPARMSFSHVEFGLDTHRKNKYALPNDPKAALAILEARKRKEEKNVQKRIERGQDAEQVREAAEQAERWGKAIAAAEGVRIRDNEHILKQTLKRREKTKQKSTKAWNDRRRAEEEAQAAKQKKRMENLAARKESKRSPGKSTKPSAKQSKARPGFEGNSRSFGGAPKRKGNARPSKS
ncbi:hypothetical protein MPSI1_000479 [Malassezia psittaci]|uniref:Ribosomal RNA-processing protein 14 n=1 Tax=Malassezia psittaci TaxID=1821823 RepID=A0AAF0FBD4_9BASI|nr:hypothetical protein MPSI1_000479 [Malassezia psittaci]